MNIVYTHGQHETVLRSHRWRTAENSAAYLLPHLFADATLLDVGCGQGSITADLAGRVGRVTAVDRSPEALDHARRTLVEKSNVSLEPADVHDLRFADDTFDIVHAHQVLQHVADPVRALREMRRVCRPGGIVAARDSDYAAMTWFPQAPALDEWLALYRTVARGNGGEPDAGRRLLSWAREAGFTDVVSTASAWCFSTPSERLWWGDMWADRIVESDIATQAISVGHATAADLERMSAAWRAWARAEDGWFAVLHGEIIGHP